MTTATDMLAKYLAAEAALLQGKEVSFGDKRLRMEDLPAIREGRKEWEQRANAETLKSSGAPTLGGLSFSVANFNPGYREGGR